MSETRTQILHSIQQAIDSDWHNWQKLSYIRSRIQELLDQETSPTGSPRHDRQSHDRQCRRARDWPGASIFGS
jgi:hypothetical protein